jgi:hypothetical protein
MRVHPRLPVVILLGLFFALTPCEGAAADTPRLLTINVREASFEDCVRAIGTAAMLMPLMDGDAPEGRFRLAAVDRPLSELMQALFEQLPRGERWDFEVRGRRLVLFQVRYGMHVSGPDHRPRLSFDLRHLPLREALALIEQNYSRPIRVASDVPEVRISVRARDLSPHEAIRTIIRVAAERSRGVSMRPHQGGYRISVQRPQQPPGNRK